MGFWGIEVKPSKPHPYHSDNVQGTLHITQATLGLGSSKEKSILQCSIGHKSPIFLCSLLPNKIESCSLNLEFDEVDLVAFSVIGSRSIHLSGYFAANDGEYLRDEYESDSLGEDIAETESEESSEFDTEDDYDDGFIDDDDDFDMYSGSPVRNSGVVIEELTDDDKPAIGNDQSKRKKKKNQSSDSEDKVNAQQQIVVKSNAGVPVLESEDEDGFPTSASHKSEATLREPHAAVDDLTDNRTTKETKKKKKKAKDDSDPATSKKRKIKSIDQDGQVERKDKKKQKGKDKEKKVNEAGTGNEVDDLLEDEHQPEEAKSHDLNQGSPVGNAHGQKKGLDIDAESVPSENGSEKKKKKKKKKKKTEESDGGKNMNQTVSAVENENKPTLKSDKQTASKSSQVRTFPNGLVIEEVAMGKPDGKRASPGNQVTVRYIGKLKKNGKIFDSNVGKAPFKFRLGVGQVIKGWDVGVNGMRVGDKRRLMIPPSMGYGSQGAGGRIPPNAWLEFDVELLGVR